jgi:hypothetical protein
MPWDIAQTRDGYIWLGTDAGLFRFDGMRFVPWRAPYGEQAASMSNHAFAGCTRWKPVDWDGRRSRTPCEQPVDVNEKNQGWVIQNIFEDSDGKIWIGENAEMVLFAGPDSWDLCWCWRLASVGSGLLRWCRGPGTDRTSTCPIRVAGSGLASNRDRRAMLLPVAGPSEAHTPACVGESFALNNFPCLPWPRIRSNP